MAALVLEKDILGPVFTNVYYAMNADTHEMFIVDPADDPAAIIRHVSAMKGTVKAILLTHGHFDHIGAVKTLKERLSVPVYACAAEEELLKEPSLNLSDEFGYPLSVKADVRLTDLEEFTAAGFTIQMLHTPGHTKGSCCYYLKEQNVLFSGDTLFCGSAGRTDFPGGSMSEIVASLRRLTDSLPGGTNVYPGHDSATTIETEKRYNPFV